MQSPQSPVSPQLLGSPVSPQLSVSPGASAPQQTSIRQPRRCLAGKLEATESTANDGLKAFLLVMFTYLKTVKLESFTNRIDSECETRKDKLEDKLKQTKIHELIL